MHCNKIQSRSLKRPDPHRTLRTCARSAAPLHPLPAPGGGAHRGLQHSQTNSLARTSRGEGTVEPTSISELMPIRHTTLSSSSREAGNYHPPAASSQRPSRNPGPTTRVALLPRSARARRSGHRRASWSRLARGGGIGSAGSQSPGSECAWTASARGAALGQTSGFWSVSVSCGRCWAGLAPCRPPGVGRRVSGYQCVGLCCCLGRERASGGPRSAT